MSRATRLLELLIRLQAKPRFTARELAAEFGVSRRTMLRDLQELSLLGVPLVATPGPGGGYALAWPHRPPALTLTAEEAIGLVLSYEAFLAYARSPFAPEGLSAITKLRGALPPAVLREIDRVREHVAVLGAARDYEAPLLPDLLRAALDGSHLRIVYDSRSGRSERVVYPFGVFAAGGFWYCACHDERRAGNVALRADRVVSLEPVEGLSPPPAVLLREWLATRERDPVRPLRLRAQVTPAGTTSFELQTLFDRIAPDGRGGGQIEKLIPEGEVEWYAARLLGVGTDVVVESPPQLIAAMRRRAGEIVALYEGR